MSALRVFSLLLLPSVVLAYGSVNSYQINEIVYWHNKARADMANAGRCANMLEMVWDSKIASAAQTVKCPQNHNGQAEAAYGKSLGENLQWSSGSGDLTCFEGGMCSEGGICGKGNAPKCETRCSKYCTLKYAIYTGWYQQETTNPSSTTDNCLAYNSGGGHCSQVLWQSSTGVGCAYQDKGCDGIILNCNYSPPGNFNIQDYNVANIGKCNSGKACSACPSTHPYCRNSLCSKTSSTTNTGSSTKTADSSKKTTDSSKKTSGSSTKTTGSSTKNTGSSTKNTGSSTKNTGSSTKNTESSTKTTDSSKKTAGSSTSATGYKHHVSYAVSGSNIAFYTKKTVKECAAICDNMSSCLAFEYATTRSAGTKTYYAKGACTPQSSAAIVDFSNSDGYKNLDVYVKTASACVDDDTWIDTKYGGDGTSGCGDVRQYPAWCTDFGDYSVEAARACPKACGVCESAAAPTRKPSTTTTSSKCKPNKVTYCSYYLDYCDEGSQYNSWMVNNCAKACCDRAAAAASSKATTNCAADKQTYCGTYVQSCSTSSAWYSWMQDNCATTCCGFKEGSCAADLNTKECYLWGKYCNDYPEYMAKNCATTCCGK